MNTINVNNEITAIINAAKNAPSNMGTKGSTSSNPLRPSVERRGIFLVRVVGLRLRPGGYSLRLATSGRHPPAGSPAVCGGYPLSGLYAVRGSAFAILPASTLPVRSIATSLPPARNCRYHRLTSVHQVWSALRTTATRPTVGREHHFKSE